MKIVGTCETLEKGYFRLTAVRPLPHIPAALLSYLLLYCCSHPIRPPSAPNPCYSSQLTR